ncbi:RNA-binding S4 domain-containing protein [Iodidimonas sp. SYSU 1G8]|uniref:RNA-binding S4 domain-containing protein n=1 Tax=Iodidimonas sp. SYSU 1G8 TaxID=3133967 RepID=UPI0031FF1162
MHEMALRVDKWLWYARFYKSRSLAAKHIQAGDIRVNRQRISKASAILRIGDVLTFAQGDLIRVIEVVALGERRGPAPEARALYHDLAPSAGCAMGGNLTVPMGAAE